MSLAQENAPVLPGLAPAWTFEQAKAAEDVHVVFYSAKSRNTARFVEKLGFDFEEITTESSLEMEKPFILVIPTYNGRVPSPVIRFLNNPINRVWLRGVAVSGNTNFGSEFGAAGRTISSKCQVPLLHTFELTGMPEDILTLQLKAISLWNNHLITDIK